MPGSLNLPIEYQIIFWLLFIFIGALCGIVVYWTKRYVDGQDKRMESIEARFSNATDKVNKVAESLRTSGITVKFEFLEFRKEVTKSHEEFRKELGVIRSDLSHAMIRTLTVKDNMIEIEKKTKSMIEALDTEKTQVTDIHGKVKVLEDTQGKIVTVLQKINEKLLKVSQKKIE